MTATPDPDQELRIGRRLLEKGHLDDALMRAARALAVSPTRSDVLSFVDGVLAAHPHPLSMLELVEGVSFGIVALRARALALTGRLVAAADLALQVAAFRPSMPTVSWARDWLRGVSPADAEGLAPRLAAYVQSVLTHPLLPVDLRPNAEAACDILRDLQACPATADEASFLRAALLRRLGRADAALRLAQEHYDKAPSWLSAIEVASCHRDLQRYSDAAAWYRRATELDPADAAAWADLGRVLVADHRPADAILAFKQALRLDPLNETARASLVRLAQTSS